MKKNKGFTLIELIIVLALTSVVIAVASTFFISTIKTFKKAEISSNLQLESEQIESLLVTVGLQSKGIEEVRDLEGNSLGDIPYEDLVPKPDNGKIKVEKVKFKLLNGYYVLEYDEITSTLKVRKEDEKGEELKEDGYQKVLSENISEFTIRPIDFKMNEDGTLYNTKAIEINLNIKDIDGKSGVEIPFSLMVKFRNK